MIISNILFFLPALIILVSYTACFLTEAERVRDIFKVFGRLCFAVQAVCVWVVGSRMIQTYRRRLDDYYSDDRSFALFPINVLLHLFGAIAVFSIILNMIGREWFAGKLLVVVPSVLMSLSLYALGYVVSQFNIPASAILSDDSEQNKEPVRHSLRERFEEIMQEKKPYLSANLTIQDLATMLGTNRTYLSEMFRTEYGMSFSTYINNQRIENAKHILSDPQYETHKEAIIMAQIESGFASDSTFYHLFKKFAGKSPLAYRQEQLSSLKI